MSLQDDIFDVQEAIDHQVHDDPHTWWELREALERIIEYMNKLEAERDLYSKRYTSSLVILNDYIRRAVQLHAPNGGIHR
jgi:hypothetical protein